jgi:hypothetical protein
MLVIAAVLTAIPVTDIDTGTFHRRLASVTTNVNVMTKPDDRRDRKYCRRRMKNIVSILLLDDRPAAKAN